MENFLTKIIEIQKKIGKNYCVGIFTDPELKQITLQIKRYHNYVPYGIENTWSFDYLINTENLNLEVNLFIQKAKYTIDNTINSTGPNKI